MFEVTEGLSIICHGQIKASEGIEMTDVTPPEHNDSFKLLENDFYKEMRLRGYYHKDLFRSITESRDDGLEGKIKWNSNWTAFIDCLLQFQVLLHDTRMLVLPTKFRKLVINPLIHKQILSQSTDELVYAATCPFSKVIRAGGIEIYDFEGSAVNRRRPIADPVLEVYKFIPHFPTTPTLSTIDMAKFCIQLLLENTPTTRLVSVEVDSDDKRESMSEFIVLGLSDLPMITSDINYLTSKQVELDNVIVQDKSLSDFDDVNLIIKSRCINDTEFLKAAKDVLTPNGFIVSRECVDTKLPVKIPDDLQLVATIPAENEIVLFFQFAKAAYKKPDSIIKISSNVDDWLEPLKEAIKNGSVLIVSDKERDSGILGLFNCVRREGKGGSTLTCVAIEDSTAPPFDINHPFYKLRLEQGLAVNVFKNNQWGSYRHVQLTTDSETKQRKEHYYANCLIKGDISSLNWFEGTVDVNNFKADPHCVRVQYSALNFRDVMQASGKITFDYLNRIQQQCLLGHEFSGVRSDGQRVAGLGVAGGFATYYGEPECYYWNVPDHWSLAEAATVPLVYCTVFIAFFHAAQVQRGQSVLIHAGSGGVGLAALYIAFHHGFEVFTTVGSPEKRAYLLKEFPFLKPENIGNSRDTSFERMINVITKGRGVDYVLNSLSEDKLVASLRCLADGGTFLEIGKFDIINKTKIDLGFLARKISIKAVFVESSGSKGTSGNFRIEVSV